MFRVLALIAGRAQELKVARVIGAAQCERHDVIDVVAGAEFGVAAGGCASAALHPLKSMNVGQGVAAGSAALSVTTALFMDAQNGAVGFGPFGVIGGKALFVGVSKGFPAGAHFGLIGCDVSFVVRKAFDAMLGVRSGFCGFDLFRTVAPKLRARFAMASQTLFAGCSPFAYVPVYARNAGPVTRQSAFFGLLAGDDGAGVNRFGGRLTASLQNGISVTHPMHGSASARQALFGCDATRAAVSTLAGLSRIVMSAPCLNRLLARDQFNCNVRSSHAMRSMRRVGQGRHRVATALLARFAMVMAFVPACNSRLSFFHHALGTSALGEFS